MILPSHLNALRAIHDRLQDSGVVWVITGSLGMALQGVDVAVYDVDLQTDRQGAYEIERLFSECVVTPVRFSAAGRIRSHYGALEIAGAPVEIMGDVQKRLGDGTWEEPVDVTAHRLWVEIEGMRLPVLSLAYEYRAYHLLGRDEKAEMLKRWLDGSAQT